jgi:hypothetical protein
LSHQLRVQILSLAITAAVAAPAPASASTPEAWALLDRQSAAACLNAAGARDGQVGPPTRFSDSSAVEVRVVSGGRGDVLCLYDRRARRAEVQELALGFLPGAGVAPEVRLLSCGQQQFRVAFSDEAAAVDLPDGQRVELPNINAGRESSAPRVYTNGRVTFRDDVAGRDRVVTFARGRMAPVACDDIDE